MAIQASEHLYRFTVTAMFLYHTIENVQTSLANNSSTTDPSALKFDKEVYHDILQIIIKFVTDCSDLLHSDLDEVICKPLMQHSMRLTASRNILVFYQIRILMQHSMRLIASRNVLVFYQIRIPNLTSQSVNFLKLD